MVLANHAKQNDMVWYVTHPLIHLSGGTSILGVSSPSSSIEKSTPVALGSSSSHEFQKSASVTNENLLDSAVERRNLTQSWRLKDSDSTNDNTFTGTALHFVAAYNKPLVVAYLIGQGAQREIRNDESLTPLHIAAWNGHDEIAHILLRSCVDVNCRDFKLLTPLHLAALKGQIHIVYNLSLYGVDLDARDWKGRSAMDYAISNRRADIVSCLMGFGQRIVWFNRQTCSPLCSSISSKSDELSLFILDFTQDYSLECPVCGSLLHKIIFKDQATVLRRLFERRPEKELRHAMANSSNEILPPLCVASGVGDLDMIRVMLEAGADIGILSKPFGTPLGIACAMGQLDAVKFLIERGAKTSWRELDGKVMTAAERAKDQNHVYRWLQGTGCHSIEAHGVSKSTTTSSLKKGRKKDLGYRKRWECLDTVDKIRIRHPSMIRRRSSFVLDYALRKQESIPKLIKGAAILHDIYFKGRFGLLKQPHSRKETIWGTSIRAHHGTTYCKAVCRFRAMIPPERYYMYPLFSHATKATSDGPWEIL